MLSTVRSAGAAAVPRVLAVGVGECLNAAPPLCTPVAPLSTAEPLKETALHSWHLERGAKMGAYAGYDLPLLYKGATHIESHNWTRESASLFDVSHMGQLVWSGRDVIPFLERLIVADLISMVPSQSVLSVITDENGGLFDDTIVTKVSDTEFGMVVNGGCKDADMEHFREQIALHPDMDVTFDYHEEQQLVALQGPKAKDVLQPLVGDLDLAKHGAMTSFRAMIDGTEVGVMRGGYTGEDGFEISIPHGDIERICTMLCDNDAVLPAGLAPRDSLRLEAGLCLYGNEISHDTNPIEANLAWVIHRARRKGDRANFLGAEPILTMLNEKSWSRRLVGILVEEGRRPPRGGYKVYESGTDNEIGESTSGTKSITLGKGVCMAYIRSGHTKRGTAVDIDCRGKLAKGIIVQMPFVKHNFYRIPAE